MADDEFTELAAAVDERRCRDEYGFGTYAEAAALYRPDPACPSCGAAEPFRDGWSESGLQRYRGPADTTIASPSIAAPPRDGPRKREDIP